MQISKINFYNFNSKNNINFKSKPILTKTKLEPKIDMFFKSTEIKKVTMDRFINLRDSFAEKLKPIALNMYISEWNFYINSTKENFEILSKTRDKYVKIWQNKTFYNKFLKIKDIDLNKNERKQLKYILKNFEEELNTGDDLNKLTDKENKIAKKYNSYIPKIDGKKTTKAEINKILETESNPEIRKKAYEASIQGGDLIAKDLQELVKKRNKYAKKQGYSNFFEYKLKDDFEVDLKELEDLLDNVYNKSKDLIKIKLTETKKELSEFFGISEEDLKSYHYGFLTENNPEKKVNDFIKTKEQIVDIAKKTYQGMGYDIENLEKNGNLTLDFFPDIRDGRLCCGLHFRILGCEEVLARRYAAVDCVHDIAEFVDVVHIEYDAVGDDLHHFCGINVACYLIDNRTVDDFGIEILF